MKTVNLIYYNNGVGLSKDAHLLNSILKDHFHVNFHDVFSKRYIKADINFFLQNIDDHTVDLLNDAKTNVLIPNLEWMCDFGLKYIRHFNFILAKSRLCKSQLEHLNKNVIYTGFCSIDRYYDDIPKNKQFLHFSGKSIQKYTEMVIDVFSELNLPLTIVDATERFVGKLNPNFHYIPYYLSDPEVNNIFNSHRTHICCSLAEGWGHYIWEALGCKSIVVANDCSPENEILNQNDAFLVKTSQSAGIEPIDFRMDERFPFRKLNYTDRKDLMNAILKINSLSEEEKIKIGENSRTKFFKINESFKLRMENFINIIK